MSAIQQAGQRLKKQDETEAGEERKEEENSLNCCSPSFSQEFNFTSFDGKQTRDDSVGTKPILGQKMNDGFVSKT